MYLLKMEYFLWWSPSEVCFMIISTIIYLILPPWYILIHSCAVHVSRLVVAGSYVWHFIDRHHDKNSWYVTYVFNNMIWCLFSMDDIIDNSNKYSFHISNYLDITIYVHLVWTLDVQNEILTKVCNSFDIPA